MCTYEARDDGNPGYVAKSSPGNFVTEVMARRAENLEILQKLVPEAIVGQVVNVEIAVILRRPTNGARAAGCLNG